MGLNLSRGLPTKYYSSNRIASYMGNGILTFINKKVKFQELFSKNEMLSSRRSRYLVRPRQTAIYLTKILTTKSLPEIGREFSNRDHTTIIHSVKTIEKLKEKNPDMNDNINKLKNIILYNKEG